MCILDPKIIPIRNDRNKIPREQLADILRVFSYAKREDIKELPSNFICKRNGDFWTTWDEVLDIRDIILNEKELIRKRQISLISDKPFD